MVHDYDDTAEFCEEVVMKQRGNLINGILKIGGGLSRKASEVTLGLGGAV